MKSLCYVLYCMIINLLNRDQIIIKNVVGKNVVCL